MNLFTLKVFLCRKDVKIFVFCTITGGVMQVIANEYLKRHPEFLKDAPVTKKKYKQPKVLSPRGGALVEVSGISIKIMANSLITFIAKKGLLAGLITGGGVIISSIPLTAISTYLQDSFPQNLPHLEKKKFILVDGEKIYFDQCEQGLVYLFKMLADENFPYEAKEQLARSILTKYLNRETMSGLKSFALCIIVLLYLLSIQNQSGYYIMLQNLIRAIKEGRMSKPIGRLIVRRLRKKGVLIDPELIDIVSS